MIFHSIKAAKDSQCFDQIIVSTDDNEIAEVAKSAGADIPFVRPGNLADDYTPTVDVIAHALEFLSHQGKKIDLACCIYATAPFIKPATIRQGLEVIQKGDVEFCFTATSFGFPIQRGFKLSQNSRVEMFNPEEFYTRSQDLEPAYHDAGQFYWGKTQAFLAKKPFFSTESRAIVLPRHTVQDIDTPEDWIHAEMQYEILRSMTANRIDAG